MKLVRPSFKISFNVNLRRIVKSQATVKQLILKDSNSVTSMFTDNIYVELDIFLDDFCNSSNYEIKDH